MASGNYGEISFDKAINFSHKEHGYVWDYTYDQLIKMNPDICLLSDVLDFFKSHGKSTKVLLEINFNDEMDGNTMLYKENLTIENVMEMVEIKGMQK
jgi:hypothetical protein